MGVEVESIDGELLPAYIWWRWTLEPVFGGCNGSKHPESLVVITLQLSELPCQTHCSEGVPYLVESFAGHDKVTSRTNLGNQGIVGDAIVACIAGVVPVVHHPTPSCTRLPSIVGWI